MARRRKKEEKNNAAALIIFAAFAGFLWFILIALKAAGIVSLTWGSVLLGVLWVPCYFALALLVLFLLLKPLANMAAGLKRWLRRRKNDRRIIRQAKEFGIWYTFPPLVRGRALELKAWQEVRIKPRKGETEREFLQRYVEKQRRRLQKYE